jgi:hypothetical protein
VPAWASLAIQAMAESIRQRAWSFVEMLKQAQAADEVIV